MSVDIPEKESEDKNDKVLFLAGVECLMLNKLYYCLDEILVYDPTIAQDLKVLIPRAEDSSMSLMSRANLPHDYNPYYAVEHIDQDKNNLLTLVLKILDLFKKTFDLLLNQRGESTPTHELIYSSFFSSIDFFALPTSKKRKPELVELIKFIQRGCQEIPPHPEFTPEILRKQTLRFEKLFTKNDPHNGALCHTKEFVSVSREAMAMSSTMTDNAKKIKALQQKLIAFISSSAVYRSLPEKYLAKGKVFFDVAPVREQVPYLISEIELFFIIDSIVTAGDSFIIPLISPLVVCNDTATNGFKAGTEIREEMFCEIKGDRSGRRIQKRIISTLNELKTLADKAKLRHSKNPEFISFMSSQREHLNSVLTEYNHEFAIGML